MLLPFTPALPPQPLQHSPLSIVSAMITPGILILAAGSLISSTLTRLARVVDRSRQLIDRLAHLREQGASDQGRRYLQWLAAYTHRTLLIEKALQIFYTAIALFVVSTLAIAAANLADISLLWIAPVIVVIGTGGLLWGTTVLILETRLATGTIRDEIEDAFSELESST